MSAQAWHAALALQAKSGEVDGEQYDGPKILQKAVRQTVKLLLQKR